MGKGGCDCGSCDCGSCDCNCDCNCGSCDCGDCRCDCFTTDCCCGCVSCLDSPGFVVVCINWSSNGCPCDCGPEAVKRACSACTRVLCFLCIGVCQELAKHNQVTPVTRLAPENMVGGAMGPPRTPSTQPGRQRTPSSQPGRQRTPSTQPGRQKCRTGGFCKEATGSIPPRCVFCRELILLPPAEEAPEAVTEVNTVAKEGLVAPGVVEEVGSMSDSPTQLPESAAGPQSTRGLPGHDAAG